MGSYSPQWALHTWDWILLYGQEESAISWPLHSWTDADAAMSRRLQKAITEFGATGQVAAWNVGAQWPATGYLGAAGIGSAVTLQGSIKPNVKARGMVGQAACVWHAHHFGVWNYSVIN